MPSPEHGPTGPPAQPRRHEQGPVPYHRTARFADEMLARRVYAAVQDTLFATPCDVSAYRFLLNQEPHVAVLGEPPPDDLDERLQSLLAAGEPATLPPEVLAALGERRRQMSRRGPWTEARDVGSGFQIRGG